jgi:hypothetical protein
MGDRFKTESVIRMGQNMQASLTNRKPSAKTVKFTDQKTDQLLSDFELNIARLADN